MKWEGCGGKAILSDRIGLCDDPYAITLCQGRRQTWRRDGGEEAEGWEMKKEVWGWVMGGYVEGRCGRNSRVARTLKLVCHSVRQSAYSQTQTQVAHSICANVSIFTHTQEAHKKHSFSLHQHKLEEGNILFFVLCHRLIRFHHHSNAFPLSTVFSSFLTSLTLSATL